ncbi:MAG: response regulator transcription factor [Sedimentibacter sp.]
MESIASDNLIEIKEGFENIVIFEISESDNIFKQISIEEFLEKLKNYELKSKRSTSIITYGSLKININSSDVYRDGEKIDLSPREYRLLRLFIDNKGKILTSEQIINCVWGVAYANTGMLRVAIKRLRIKIDPMNKYLKTIRGKGYIFVDF